METPVEIVLFVIFAVISGTKSRLDPEAQPVRVEEESTDKLLQPWLPKRHKIPDDHNFPHYL